MLLLLLQAATPGDCLLTGLCGVSAAPAGPPSGVLFLALGLVLAGAIGLRRERRR
jgi:MYXO-CTERM domain-containing protein